MNLELESPAQQHHYISLLYSSTIPNAEKVAIYYRIKITPVSNPNSHQKPEIKRIKLE